MDFIAEWTFEGGLKLTKKLDCKKSKQRLLRVGSVGNRTRYQSGVYVCT